MRLVQFCHLLDSPGPAPAPEPELLPSDLSSDWPTGREGGMVNMKIYGMVDGGRKGSNSKNHTQGLVAHPNIDHTVHRSVLMSKASMPLEHTSTDTMSHQKHSSTTGCKKIPKFKVFK